MNQDMEGGRKQATAAPSAAAAASLNNVVPHPPPEWREYAAGWGASMVNVTITFPIHKTMFRQMVHGFSMFDALRQLRKEGAFRIYRGILPPLLASSASRCLMFGTYAQYSRQLGDTFPSSLNNKLYIQSAAAFLAGCTEATLAPFERVQVILQDSKHNCAYRNTAHALRELWVRHGVREYYRGLTAVLLRNGPSNIIFFGSREKIRESLPEEWGTNSDFKFKYLADFLCGAVTGAFISTMFYPINATKTHMQLVVGGEFTSFFTVFRELLRSRGLLGMYKGVHLNYSRSFLSWGIINVTYEYLHKRLQFVSDQR